MQLIEANSYIPQIEHAPHKMYVVEFTIDELAQFNRSPKRVLKTMEPFTDTDDSTNIIVNGLDGAKPAEVRALELTHGVIFDFRPIAIHVVYWVKPPADYDQRSTDTIVPVTRKGDS